MERIRVDVEIFQRRLVVREERLKFRNTIVAIKSATNSTSFIIVANDEIFKIAEKLQTTFGELVVVGPRRWVSPAPLTSKIHFKVLYQRANDSHGRVQRQHPWNYVVFDF